MSSTKEKIELLYVWANALYKKNLFSKHDLNQIKTVRAYYNGVNASYLGKDFFKKWIEKLDVLEPNERVKIMICKKLGEADMPVIDQDIKNRIINFFKQNPKPNDQMVHNLSKQLNINPHELETIIYEILSGFLNPAPTIEGIKVEERIREDENIFDDGEIETGIKVEKEHKQTILKIINDAKNGQIKPLLYYYKLIALDHIKEDNAYYQKLLSLGL
jgi:hypothetical protein